MRLAQVCLSPYLPPKGDPHQTIPLDHLKKCMSIAIKIHPYDMYFRLNRLDDIQVATVRVNSDHTIEIDGVTYEQTIEVPVQTEAAKKMIAETIEQLACDGKIGAAEYLAELHKTEMPDNVQT